MPEFLSKLVLIVTPGCFTSVLNFILIEVQACKLKQPFQVLKKTTKEKWTWKFACSYLRSGSWNFLKVYYAVFLSRQAPSQQIWHWSNERSRSYEWVKIAPLFLLHSLCAPRFLMPQDALRCVLVTTPNLVGNASYWELCSSTCECT